MDMIKFPKRLRAQRIGLLFDLFITFLSMCGLARVSSVRGILLIANNSINGETHLSGIRGEFQQK